MTDAPESDVSARQWSILARDGTTAFTSEDVALRVASGDHGWTLGLTGEQVVASFARADPDAEWTQITGADLLADLTATRERLRVVEGERDAAVASIKDWADDVAGWQMDALARKARAESAEAERDEAWEVAGQRRSEARRYPLPATADSEGARGEAGL